MGGIIIGQKSLLEKITPHLREFFPDEQYTFYNVDDLLYTVKGGGKLSQILQQCGAGSVETLLFVTKNDQTRDIAHRLKGLSVPAYYIPHYLYADISSIPNLRDASVVVDLQKPRLNYLEFHVADHCNLNCKGCGHYSNLEPKALFADFDTYVKDLHDLKKLFWGIDKIRLMGGEPLLNPELWKFIMITREVFPDTDLRIATNGLLIPKISDQLVSVMLEAHAGFDITNYPPTEKMKEKIFQRLDACDLDYAYPRKTVTQFFRKLTREPINEKTNSYWNCESRTCNFLRNGVIATCPLVALIDKFNTAFELTFPIPVNERHIISEVENPWKLVDDLNRPIEFCRYCSPAHELFDWEQCPGKRARAEDWIVDDAKIPTLVLRRKLGWWTDHLTNPKTAISRDLGHFPCLKNHVLTVYQRLLPRSKP